MKHEDVSLYYRMEFWRYESGKIEYVVTDLLDQPIVDEDLIGLLREVWLDISEKHVGSETCILVELMEDGSMTSTYQSRDWTEYETFMTSRMNLHKVFNFRVFKNPHVPWWYMTIWKLEWWWKKLTRGFKPSESVSTRNPTGPASGPPPPFDEASEGLEEGSRRTSNVIPLPVRKS